MNKVQKEFVETVLIMWEAIKTAHMEGYLFRVRLHRGVPLDFSNNSHDREDLSHLRNLLNIAVKRCDDLFGRRGPSPKEIRKGTIYEVEDSMLNDIYSLLSASEEHVDKNRLAIITKLTDLSNLASVDMNHYYRTDDIDDIKRMVNRKLYNVAKKQALHLLRTHDARRASNHNGTVMTLQSSASDQESAEEKLRDFKKTHKGSVKILTTVGDSGGNQSVTFEYFNREKK